MFTHIIVQPIFNLLVLIYALLPGHNFGLALIIFTIVIRLLLWPLVKRQLHQTKAMRKLQPEMKRIKKESKGSKQKEQQLLMELYKEKGINPLGTLPTLIVQFIVLIGLYSGLRKVIANPHNLVSFAYPSLQHLHWMRLLAKNIHLFDNTLFGVVNLSKAAFSAQGIYLPALIIVLGSAIAQYYQGKQLLPDAVNENGEKRSLRTIMKEASSGNSADQSEVNAAVGRSTKYLLPLFIFIVTVRYSAALSLYWLTGGLAAFVQQYIVLRGDETEMEALADAPTRNVAAIPEAEVVSEAKASAKPKAKTPTTSKSKAKKAARRRNK